MDTEKILQALEERDRYIEKIKYTNIKLKSSEISKIITDNYNAKILTATYKKPKSVADLSSKLDIPIAACYRRIRYLEKKGILKRTQGKDRVGKQCSLFKSKVPGIVITFEDGVIKTGVPVYSRNSKRNISGW